MKLYYIYDALCGWCYGFSPVITAFYEKYHTEITFEVISGGMVTVEREGPIGEVAGYIKTAYLEVEKQTGVKFGEGFLKNILEEGTTLFTSVPPAVALSVFKKEKPAEQIAFAAALQTAIYSKGIDPSDPVAYGQLAVDFDLDPNEFVRKMEEEEYQRLALRDFMQTQRWGVNGFPTVVIETGEQLAIIGRGYLDFESLERNFESAKTQLAAAK
ncbi:MAG: DsbA family protein [Saprospiraceae bacterium]